MKREGFWRYATPPVNIQGVPLPFTMIYLFICPFPSKTTFWICTGIILFPRFYVSTSKSIIKALINMHSFEIQLSPIG